MNIQYRDNNSTELGTWWVLIICFCKDDDDDGGGRGSGAIGSSDILVYFFFILEQKNHCSINKFPGPQPNVWPLLMDGCFADNIDNMFMFLM